MPTACAREDAPTGHERLSMAEGAEQFVPGEAVEAGARDDALAQRGEDDRGTLLGTWAKVPKE